MSIPWRYLPPNLATFASVVVGVAAMRSAALGDIEGGAWLVLLCMFLDKLDGGLARALNAQSRFGVEMDSFADFVAFGLAPGFLMMSMDGGIWSLSFLFASLFIGASLGRLVRFNVEDALSLPDSFRGLPTTVAGGVMSLLVLVGYKYELQPEALRTLLWGASVVLGLLMVSALPLPKFGKSKSRVFNALMYAGVLSSLVTVLLRVWPEYTLAQAGIYVIIGVVGALSRGGKG